ncbi:unnamed protein product [Oncorhynchus mykiss]|uniref:Dystrobrevin alpha n=1 Tax=Oncorhynchus mykiss TaxID=8022 RepID=A0A060WDZ9_ONCMY|nr:unnamed protein product [Oncorhynchus mykiss]
MNSFFLIIRNRIIKNTTYYHYEVTLTHASCFLFQTQGPGSPRSSPSHTVSRSIPMPTQSESAGTTPTHTPQDSLMGVGGDVQEAFAQGPRRNLRNDLLVAADSITNTMSSLVKELNSEAGSQSESNMDSQTDELFSSPTSDPLAQMTTKPRLGGRNPGGVEEECYENDLVQVLEDELKMGELLKHRREQEKPHMVTLQQ